VGVRVGVGGIEVGVSVGGAVAVSVGDSSGACVVAVSVGGIGVSVEGIDVGVGGTGVGVGGTGVGVAGSGVKKGAGTKENSSRRFRHVSSIRTNRVIVVFSATAETWSSGQILN
jgi:hypothetical protein